VAPSRPSSSRVMPSSRASSPQLGKTFKRLDSDRSSQSHFCASSLA
jgi:hypothetical protein